MNEILTMKEINERYDGEWVLLEDPVKNDRNQTVRGKLRWHTKDRAELNAKALEFKLKHGAIFYIGKGPEGMLYCY